ncbi:MAG: hypothetical protein U0574_08400 [Phycisphaerales bacterium]
MSNTSMSVAVGLVGVGLCTIGLGLMFGPRDAAHAAPGASGPAEPTVVAFLVTPATPVQSNPYSYQHLLWRMWSNGTVEAKQVWTLHPCEPDADWQSCGDWKAIPGTAAGFACAPDINGDRVVDGADLALVLGSWGQAPSCVELPPIACTLGEIKR